ncbi:hypothetical protein SAMN05421753_11585 [Planctomicrobium piriforme]|uniref:N-acetyltransferase domain-containing protein n=2 Tax=Planctomicrobium piriforme TaxID=1576369 RepID=A0A1I3NGJ6_9PLAN|nr:hypothetical protein SAMN05421753_11585 [Planctomicrobium piriforme]
MELELQLSNERRAIPSAAALLHAALQQLPIAAADADQIEQLVLRVVGDAVDHAYPSGMSGIIKLSVREKQGRLEIGVRDFGLPQDVASLERRLHEKTSAANSTSLATTADELHWINHGREGKAFQLVKWLSSQNVRDQSTGETLEAFDNNAALAPPQNYDIRRMRSEEALQVCQLMYRAYGNTYFNEDVYYPDRVAAQNDHNSVLSFVAVAEDGTVAGHYALELNQPGLVAEGGQAVVDPAHRGRGLLDKMKAVALVTAKELNLAGWYADAVAVHTLTQRSDVTHGGRLCAADLAISPETERFVSIADTQPQRISCMLYFHWLTTPTPRTISIPQRHRAIVSEIYQGLDCELSFHPDTTPVGHGTLTIAMDPGGAKAFLRVDDIGSDTIAAIRHAQRQLIERSHMQTIYAELPLAHPAAAQVATELEADGFGFIGIAPHFSKTSDILRLAYLVNPLTREPIKTYEPAADRLVNYALAEQARVHPGD